MKILLQVPTSTKTSQRFVSCIQGHMNIFLLLVLLHSSILRSSFLLQQISVSLSPVSGTERGTNNEHIRKMLDWTITYSLLSFHETKRRKSVALKRDLDIKSLIESNFSSFIVLLVEPVRKMRKIESKIIILSPILFSWTWQFARAWKKEREEKVSFQ